jgi:fructan beta-fructosidase
MRSARVWQFLSIVCPLLLFPLGAAAEGPRADVVVADFEGEDYGAWKVTGTAFGKGPAHGTLPGQMEVSGFQGRGLVNSFVGGDDSTGTLTSPSIQIERPFLNFLVGGGGYAHETCLNLKVNGAVVRMAIGPNTSPGGNERLDWSSWDVREFLGQSAVLEIVDNRKGVWGHINIDQIVQSDRRQGLKATSRSIALTERYLHLPVQNSAPVRKVTIQRHGDTIRAFDIKLAEGKPDFWVFDDVESLHGKTVDITAELPVGSTALAKITQGPEPPDARTIGHEFGRPRFHFTSRRGWLNDPNGLVYQNGEYHLFYQHNPYGWDWGNMHWGHAVSRDLVRWTEVGEAIRPRAYGDWAFSGSAVIDRENTSGFGVAGQAALVAAFTSTGRGECIVFSNDGGRTFTEFDENPVVKHRGRDPRLFWHAKTRRWVMAVYDEDQNRQSIAFHASPDLKTWLYESRIEPFFECPDIFELPVVVAAPSTTRWVLYGADGQYLLGDFDGKTFTPDSPAKQRLWYGNFYAAQTFSDTPDGRRIQIGWANGITFPGEPFNQQMTVPVVLSLRETLRGPRLFAQPVPELKTLRNEPREVADVAVTPVCPFAIDLAESSDVELDLKIAGDTLLEISLGGNQFRYDASEHVLTTGTIRAPLTVADGVLTLRILVDRGSVELFADDGAVAFSLPLVRSTHGPRLTVSSSRGDVRVVSGRAYELKSIWP